MVPIKQEARGLERKEWYHYFEIVMARGPECEILFFLPLFKQETEMGLLNINLQSSNKQWKEYTKHFGIFLTKGKQETVVLRPAQRVDVIDFQLTGRHVVLQGVLKNTNHSCSES